MVKAAGPDSMTFNEFLDDTKLHDEHGVEELPRGPTNSRKMSNASAIDKRVSVYAV